MENYGLVTYRTIYILYDPKQSGATAKQRIAYVVAHELAHQWFGNLVTMDWWSDLWLNEGFATWAGWLAVDHIFPEWHVWTQFVNDDYQRGLGLDGLRSSHPIEVPVKNPSEIHQIFDAISYSKGASVIRMLAEYLTLNDFRQGVRNYLKEFKYRNAETKDLWRHLEQASGKPVSKLMQSWTRQTGYPVLSLKEQVDANGVSVHVSQERFLSADVDDLPTPEASSDPMWFVPLQIVTASSENKPTSDILHAKEGTFKLHGFDAKQDSSFYKLNYGQTGFYRVNYTDDALKRIGRAIASGKFGKSDRIGVITDIFALSEAGYTSVAGALQLLENFKNEDSYTVWSDIAAELAKVRSVFWEEPDAVRNGLKAFTRSLYSGLATKMGWEYSEKEGHLDQMMRTLALGVAGKAGDTDVVKEAQRRFKLFAAGDESAVHPNIRGSVYSIVLQNGGKDEYEAVLKIYREAKVVDQKLAALGALGSIKDASLLRRTLDMSMTDAVRPQDIIYIIGPVASNQLGRAITWPWVKENWDILYQRYYKSSMSLLSRIVSSSVEDFGSQKWYEDVEGFFKDKEVSSINRAIQQSLEKIKAHTSWLDRDRNAVADWLKKNSF